VLRDHTTAPIDEKLRATLDFLKKVTLAPAQVSAADVQRLRALGLSRAAINEALHVCFLFNIMDRLADSMGWHVPSQAGFEASARHLLKRGYRG
jgi:alkylhydroperoxidase family enzyme